MLCELLRVATGDSTQSDGIISFSVTPNDDNDAGRVRIL
jgi:hypothetical protein